MHKRLTRKVLILVSSISILTSCGSKKDIVYFQDSSNFETIIDKDNFVPKFKVDDEVAIYVSTLNPEASIPFNLFRRVGESGGGEASQVNYLIDEKGEIDFPVIGKIKIVGLSPEEVRVLLQKKLSDYLKDPIINIRLRNFTVTILGEVNNPGTFPVFGEQVTILEALGLAGDISIQGKRDNVLVIRDFNGTKVYNRIDLRSKNAMSSPVFYLTQNDVVYVEPNSSRIGQSTIDPRVGLYVSVIGAIATITTIILTNN
ncbi:polysaccharide biosynthesis/export family protein [Costertonia aggregata]|uniref:Polysaccharide biosynthesis/export family protein n=1 Tax=Costertonia aggregata TaxID=343403 RepID=A0A7H9ATD2_9FLAO|nr:polysaccharide biosynthesis/export family protein [Costertonia aggregata]QLG46714.1 polysaccharide biosynthesis/export family protein [Costertonia aggregata]